MKICLINRSPSLQKNLLRWISV
ncbi:replication factor C (activator 1) 4 (predicted), isoform CRA_b [Rattus norvegicus]|uniref:Replication factor C (Activator 1) 4 (Predicted), isoform CRA_b n=1 Tax=Rattus norvegicus TaxID=10116 RepID=A6JS29_RAT|nr:replication factor C (activator 1) 4 (predicted), isoform CRA_b [Rattus norvegicus]